MKRNEEHIGIRIIFSIVSFIMAILGIGLVIHAIVRGRNHDLWYKVAVMAWVLVFVLFNDVIQAFVEGNVKIKIKNGYAVYVLLDLAAMMSLGFFSINADNLLSSECCLSFVAFVVFTCAKVYVNRIISHAKEIIDNADADENVYIYQDNSDREMFPDPQLMNDRFMNESDKEKEIKTYIRK